MKFDLLNSDAQESRPIGRRDHLTFRGNVWNGRHGWLRLTPAYSLHVVRSLVEEHQGSGFVLDPFSGTGTTALVCSSVGVGCHAVDINPFLTWLGNLKVTQFPPGTDELLRRAAKSVLTRLMIDSEKAKRWVPNLHAIEKWWHEPDRLHGLACLFGEIASSNAPPHLVALMKVAFCKVMIQSANVSFSHQSMSFKKPEGNGQLSLLDDPAQSAPEFEAPFLKAIEEISSSIDSERPRAEAEVFLGDSRELAKALPRSDYTRVVTSPPYPNRMSYIRELRPYMYWLGYLQDGRQAGELDWQAIGGTWGCATSLLGTWKPSGAEVPFDGFGRIVESIGRNHKLLGRYVHKYFEDMRIHIRSLGSVLAPRASCHYIVGNSKFYDTLLPVEEIFAALFTAEGFTDVRIETLRKRTSKKELFEYAVHAVKP